jgi:hypothetical protein
MLPMYIILTTKPGLYRSEATEGMRPIESHAYYYGDRHVATYIITELERTSSYVRIVETTPGGTINLVPTKFFDHFPTSADALDSLRELVAASNLGAHLVPVDANVNSH